MKTLVIYDRNRMDSVFAAAALMPSKQNLETFEFAEKGDRHDNTLYDRYLWLGVYPTKHHFTNWQDVSRQSHFVFASKANDKAAKDADISGVNWIFANDDPELLNQRAYGAPTMLERVFGLLKLETGMCAAAMLIEKEFYDQRTAQEAIMRGIYNMRTALASLDISGMSYLKSWTPVMKFDDDTRQELGELRARDVVTMKYRSIISNMADKKETTGFKLVTTYQNEDFWFTVRRLEELKLFYRNVTFGATGMIVLTNSSFMEDMKNNDVVFILNK